MHARSAAFKGLTCPNRGPKCSRSFPARGTPECGRRLAEVLLERGRKGGEVLIADEHGDVAHRVRLAYDESPSLCSRGLQHPGAALGARDAEPGGVPGWRYSKLLAVSRGLGEHSTRPLIIVRTASAE